MPATQSQAVTSKLTFWSRSVVRLFPILASLALPVAGWAQTTTFNWQQIKEKFAASNPTLKAAQLNIDESRAEEITAYLRPNPDFGLSADGTQLTPYLGVYRPFAGTQISPSISYLHERKAQARTAPRSGQRIDHYRGIELSRSGARPVCLTCRAHLSMSCRPKRSSRMPKKTSLTGIGSWVSTTSA